MERTARQGESHDKARQGNVFKGRRQLGVEKICIVDFFFSRRKQPAPPGRSSVRLVGGLVCAGSDKPGRGLSASVGGWAGGGGCAGVRVSEGRRGTREGGIWGGKRMERGGTRAGTAVRALKNDEFGRQRQRQQSIAQHPKPRRPRLLCAAPSRERRWKEPPGRWGRPSCPGLSLAHLQRTSAASSAAFRQLPPRQPPRWRPLALDLVLPCHCPRGLVVSPSLRGGLLGA